MTELLITRGLPASGKTTWAKAWVREDPEHRARVNRDSIRETVFFQEGVLAPELEAQVSRIQRGTVERLLAAGYDVVVDDMHLRAKYIREWQEFARGHRASVRIIDHFLNTPVEECIARDEARIARGERGVTGDVIREIAKRFGSTIAGEPFDSTPAETESYVYVPDTTRTPAWMVDIDGTLALMTGRGPFEWNRVAEDDLCAPVANLVHALVADGFQIVLMSGRDSSCRLDTIQWLKRHQIPFDALYMRKGGDMRNDAVVKLELFREHVAPNYHVCGVLDDRDRVVQMWRQIGLFCAQVAPGNF